MTDASTAPKSTKSPAAWSAAGVSFAFIFAIAMDMVFRVLRAYARSTFHSMPGRVFQTATPLVMAAVFLALAWLLFVKLQPSRVAAFIFLVPGLLVVALYSTQLLPFPIPLRHTFLGPIRFFIIDLGTRSSLFSLASFCVVAGLAALVRAHRHKSGFDAPPS